MWYCSSPPRRVSSSRAAVRGTRPSWPQCLSRSGSRSSSSVRSPGSFGCGSSPAITAIPSARYSRRHWQSTCGDTGPMNREQAEWFRRSSSRFCYRSSCCCSSSCPHRDRVTVEIDLMPDQKCSIEQHRSEVGISDRIEWFRNNESVTPMTKLQAIEEEIKKLSPEELAELREWFLERDAEEWDREIDSDAASGKLDRLFEKS